MIGEGNLEELDKPFGNSYFLDKYYCLGDRLVVVEIEDADELETYFGSKIDRMWWYIEYGT